MDAFGTFVRWNKKAIISRRVGRFWCRADEAERRNRNSRVFHLKNLETATPNGDALVRSVANSCWGFNLAITFRSEGFIRNRGHFAISPTKFCTSAAKTKKNRLCKGQPPFVCKTAANRPLFLNFKPHQNVHQTFFSGWAYFSGWQRVLLTAVRFRHMSAVQIARSFCAILTLIGRCLPLAARAGAALVGRYWRLGGDAAPDWPLLNS